MDDTPATRRGFLLAASTLALAAPACAQLDDHGPHQSALTTTEKEQQAFRFLALKMFVEADSNDTKGVVAIVRAFVPPGAGAAPHVHSREDEIHTVLRGHYRYRHGDVEIDAPAGTTLYMARGIPHTFRNVGDEPGEHLITLIPGGLEGYFREVSAAGLQAPRDLAKVAEIAAKYGLTNLSPSSLPLSTDH